jgi:hypothetical protein
MGERWRSLAAAGLLLGATACANPRAEEAANARTALVGMSREQVLACAGVPARSAVSGEREFFTYESQSVSGSGGPSAGFGLGIGGWGGGRYGTGIGMGVPLGGGDVRRDTCQATFVMERGVVRELNYADPQGNSNLGQCQRIVGPCMDAMLSGGTVPPPPPSRTP